MTVEEVVASALSDVTVLNGRVYPMDALKNASAPFVFYRRVSWDGEEAMEGDTGLWTADFEIHCVTKSFASLVALSGAVRMALREMQGKTIGGVLIERANVRQASPDLSEQEVNLMRRVYALQIDYQGGTENE